MIDQASRKMSFLVAANSRAASDTGSTWLPLLTSINNQSLSIAASNRVEPQHWKANNSQLWTDQFLSSGIFRV
jgi:hypothetical protein